MESREAGPGPFREMQVFEKGLRAGGLVDAERGKKRCNLGGTGERSLSHGWPACVHRE